MHSKPSLSASPAKKPFGALSKPHLKTSHHCAAWITRGCSNVHGNNATWWTPSGWRAPAKFLKQRERRGYVFCCSRVPVERVRDGAQGRVWRDLTRIRAIETERGVRFSSKFETRKRSGKIDIFCQCQNLKASTEHFWVQKRL